jgi:signal transduction histidine kinase/DNA-binding response OmpR family regulator
VTNADTRPESDSSRRQLIFFFLMGLYLCGSAIPLFAESSMKVGIYQNNPKVFLDERGNPSGFFVDIVEEISHKTDIEVTYVFGTWMNNLEKLQTGALDMLVDVSYTDERAEIYVFNTIPIIESWIQVFSLPETNIFRAQDLDKKKIGVLENSTQHRYLSQKLSKDFEISYEIKTFSNYVDQIAALKQGAIDLFLGDRFFYFSKERPEEVIPKPVIINPNGIYFAFRNDFDPDIIGRIDSVLFELKNDYQSAYYQSLNYWFNLDIGTALPIWVKLSFTILLLGVCIAGIYAFLWNFQKIKAINRELEKKVDERTENLNQALQRAESANKAKSRFLSNMSHEIRTPLNAIIGFAQILKRDASLSDKQKEQLHTIARSGEHLLGLINDILDLSKIESGKLTLEPTNFDLHALLEDLEKMFRFRTNEKGLQFLVERQLNVPRFIHADESKLKQVLINLLGNSYKFTRVGGIALRFRAEKINDESGESGDAIRLRFEIEDTGPGIPEKDIGSLFEPFQTASAGKVAGGTGLGLSISKSLIELMGGEISFETRIGRGTVFRVSIPFKKAEGATAKTIDADTRIVGLEPGSLPPKILIVDDQKDNRDLLVTLLEPLGFPIRQAENGKEALKIVEEWSPHAVLMDMLMPEMDGYEATRCIKTTEKNSGIRVIAVTASAFEDEEKKVLATGVDGYIRKPLRAEELLGMLARLFDLHYVTTDSPEDSVARNANSLSKNDLAKLSDTMIREMKKAVEDGEMKKLRELIAQTENIDSAIAHQLRNLAKAYNYEELGRLLE